MRARGVELTLLRYRMLTLLMLACGSVPANFARPNQIEVGPGGEVYVSDFHHQRIVVLDAAGAVRETWASRGIGAGHLWQVWGMAVDQDGSLLVLDQVPVDHPDRNTQIVVKRFADGRQVEEHVLLDADHQPFSIAEGIAPHPAGGYVVAETGSGELLRYDQQWAVMGRFAPYEGGDESSTGVVAAGRDLWVLEQYHHRMRRVDADGKQLAVYDRDGTGPHQVRFPKALAVCPSQQALALADLGNHRVQLYDFEGRFQRTIDIAPRTADRPLQVMDVAFTPSCDGLWVVDGKGERVMLLRDGQVEVDVRRW